MSIVFISACVCMVLAFGDVREEPPVVPGKSYPTALSIAQDLRYRDIDQVYLLAFSSKVDDRPLFVEEALIAVKSKSGKWGLAYAYRQPKESEVGANHWHLSGVADAHQYPSRDFDHRPSKDEVERFLDDSWWRFRALATGEFRVIRGMVFTETWEKVFGYRPKYQFPKPTS
jgi:hypothetical protein